jgi:predicted phosphodiesterase
MREALRTIAAPNESRRIVVIGDIHGCIDELLALLDRIGTARDDVVISVGDIVRKGPRPDRCLELWRERGYHAVVGNNEDKLLRLSRAGWLSRFLMPAPDRRVLRRRDLVDYVRTWPVAIDIPPLRVAIVHGGFLPGMDVNAARVEENRDDLIRLRYIRRDGEGWQRVPKGKEDRDAVLWSTVWRGDRTVLYGHTPLDKPRVDDKAIGLDTGCVYGGELTAAIHEHGEWRFEREPARRAYAKR